MLLLFIRKIKPQNVIYIDCDNVMYHVVKPFLFVLNKSLLYVLCVYLSRSEYYEDNFFGLRLENGSWNGLLGMIVRKEIHTSNAATLYNGQRMLAVDYLDVIEEKR
jgi:hypothetical protein